MNSHYRTAWERDRNLESPTNIATLAPDVRKIRAIAFFLFLCLFPIDAVIYTASERIGTPSLPLAFVAGALAPLLILPFLNWHDPRKVFALALFLIFSLSGALSALTSPFYDMEWPFLFLQYLANFLLGISLRESGELTIRMRRLMVAITISCCIFLIYLLFGEWSFNPHYNYLRTANGLFYWAALTVFFTPTWLWRTLLFFLVTATLFYINSRTYFFMWLMLPIVFFVVASRTSPRYIVAFVTISALLFFTYFYYWVEILDLLRSTNLRVFRILYNYEGDSSLAIRKELLGLGLEQLRTHWFYGYYNGYKEYSESGGYIHNLLSYWHQYGLIPFVCLIALLVTSGTRSYGQLSKSMMSNMTAALFTSTLMAAFLSQSYRATDLFLVIGMALGKASVKPVYSRTTVVARKMFNT